MLRKIYQGIRNWYVRRSHLKAMKTKVAAAKKLKVVKGTKKIQAKISSSYCHGEYTSIKSDSSWQSSFSDALTREEISIYSDTRSHLDVQDLKGQ